MARRKSAPTIKESELTKRLEKGKSVVGLEGYVLITATSTSNDEDEIVSDIAIKVRCVRIDAKSCGITLLVSPISGAGEFPITPCRWLDSAEAVEEHKQLQLRKQQAQAHIKEIMNSRYLKNRRDELLSLVSSMSEKDQEDFKNDLLEKGLSQNKLSMTQVGEYLVIILSIKYNLPPNSLDVPYQWNR